MTNIYQPHIPDPGLDLPDLPATVKAVTDALTLQTVLDFATAAARDAALTSLSTEQKARCVVRLGTSRRSLWVYDPTPAEWVELSAGRPVRQGTLTLANIAANGSYTTDVTFSPPFASSLGLVPHIVTESARLTAAYSNLTATGMSVTFDNWSLGQSAAVTGAKWTVTQYL